MWKDLEFIRKKAIREATDGAETMNDSDLPKRKRSRTTKGNVWLRRALCDSALPREGFVGAQGLRAIDNRIPSIQNHKCTVHAESLRMVRGGMNGYDRVDRGQSTLAVTPRAGLLGVINRTLMWWRRTA